MRWSDSGAPVERRRGSGSSPPACHRFHPDLEGEFYDVLVRLNEKPAVLAFEDPETGKPFEITLSGDRLLEMTLEALYSHMAAQFPIFPDILKEGDSYLVFSADMFVSGGESTWSLGTHRTMNCSVFPRLSISHRDARGLGAGIVRLVNENLEGFNRSCAKWGIRSPEPSTLTPAVSDIPTLLLSGMLDPNTPPRHAEIVAEHLSNGYPVAFSGMGHEAIHTHTCPRSIALDFLDDPSSPPDTSCVGEMRVRFMSEPIAAPLLALQKDPPILRLVLLLGSLFLMLSSVVVWPIAAARSRKRAVARDKNASRARWLAGVTVVLNLVSLATFIACNPEEVIYGYPPLLRVATILPLISIIQAVVGLVYVVLAWRGGYCGYLGIGGRIHYTMVILGIAVFLWQLSYWHLLGWRL